MKTIELAGTTSTGGALTITAAADIIGFIETVVMDYDDGDTGGQVVLTCENGTASQALLTQASLGTADRTWYPRTLGNKVANGAAFTDPATKMFCVGKFKAVISSGGNAKNFRFLVYVSDE